MDKIKSAVILIIVLSLFVGCSNNNLENHEDIGMVELESTIEYKNNEEELESPEETESISELSNTTESDYEETPFTMGEDAFTVKGFKCDSEKLEDRPDAELLSIYECENSDMTLFTYNAEYIDGIDNNIILRFGDRYIMYKDKVLFQEIIKDIESYEFNGESFVDPVHYIDGDFDNDGDIELACSFIMNRGSSYMNDKLCVFDYDKEEYTYNLYCLRFADFSDAVTSVISEYYGDEYIWKEIDDGVDGSIDALAAMCTGMLCKDEQYYVKWGRWENVTLGSGVPMKIGLYVSEARMIGGYYNTFEKEISCNVLYLGDGEFSVEFDEYS